MQIQIYTSTVIWYFIAPIFDTYGLKLHGFYIAFRTCTNYTKKCCIKLGEHCSCSPKIKLVPLVVIKMLVLVLPHVDSRELQELLENNQRVLQCAQLCLNYHNQKWKTLLGHHIVDQVFSKLIVDCYTIYDHLPNACI